MHWACGNVGYGVPGPRYCQPHSSPGAVGMAPKVPYRADHKTLNDLHTQRDQHNDVTWVSWRPKSPSTRLFVQQLIPAKLRRRCQREVFVFIVVDYKYNSRINVTNAGDEPVQTMHDRLPSPIHCYLYNIRDWNILAITTAIPMNTLIYICSDP